MKKMNTPAIPKSKSKSTKGKEISIGIDSTDKSLNN